MSNRNLMQFDSNLENKTQTRRGGGGGNKKKEKESRSKQARPFTSKVAKLLKVGYAKPAFKHTATYCIK